MPGVGVGSRRMSHHRHRQDDPLVFREPPPLRERLQHSTTVTMGETALMARQRLDRKLAHYRASSRLAPFSRSLLHRFTLKIKEVISLCSFLDLDLPVAWICTFMHPPSISDGIQLNPKQMDLFCQFYAQNSSTFLPV